MFRYSWVPCGFALLIVFATAAPAGASTAVGAPVRVSPTTCNPAGTSTWVLGGQGRIYELPGTFRVRDNGTRWLTPPAVYGCLFASGHPWRLNLRQSPWSPEEPTYRGVRVPPGLSPEATVLNSPWVAYRETFLGVDTGTLFVAARNLRNGKISRCFVGGFAALWFPLSIVQIVVQHSGVFAWSTEGKLGSGKRREIGACDPSGTRVTLDAGPGIDPDSLELRGSSITWTDAGTSRSYEPQRGRSGRPSRPGDLP